MLVEEARDLTGMSYADLDEALNLEPGQSARYALYPGLKKDRAPQAGSIQQLENRVAKLLKRTAHRVVIIDNAKVLSTDEMMHLEEVIGIPEAGINLREHDGASLQLEYENNWPTYRRLKCKPQNLRLYGWQWGILWDKMTPCPYRSQFGFGMEEFVEQCVSKLTEFAMEERTWIDRLHGSKSGQDQLQTWTNALLTVDEDHVLDEIHVTLREYYSCVQFEKNHTTGEIRK